MECIRMLVFLHCSFKIKTPHRIITFVYPDDTVQILNCLHICVWFTFSFLFVSHYPVVLYFCTFSVSTVSNFCFRRTPPIDPEILRTMKMQGTIGYAPNPMSCRRNQVRLQILKTPSYEV